MKKRKLESDVSFALIDVKDKLDKIFCLSRNMAVPIGLRSIIYDTFKCIICQNTMEGPVIFARCCKTLIGCQKCVDQWYRGEDGQARSCPKCRAERAFVETSRLVGLDEFLQAIGPLFDVSSPRQSAEQSE